MQPAVIPVLFEWNYNPPIATNDDYWLTANEIRVMVRSGGRCKILWELAPRYRQYEPLCKTEVVAQ